MSSWKRQDDYVKTETILPTVYDKGNGRVEILIKCIDNYLSKHDSPEDIEVYFCGPPLMNQAVEKMAEDFGVPPENVRFDDFGG